MPTLRCPLWLENVDHSVLGRSWRAQADLVPKLIEETTEKINLIKHRIQAAQIDKRGNAELKRKPMEVRSSLELKGRGPDSPGTENIPSNKITHNFTQPGFVIHNKVLSLRTKLF
ncbi:hypothetical protein Tco_0705375 [Tanacetum coccineum]|uniref:Uncharacterized protein n=1 Tax=Tanacetum coccineum TaxID=301880 RepID=A0ABQ4Y4E6_9ASTR